jgi:hypothetical protein
MTSCPLYRSCVRFNIRAASPTQPCTHFVNRSVHQWKRIVCQDESSILYFLISLFWFPIKQPGVWCISLLQNSFVCHNRLRCVWWLIYKLRADFCYNVLNDFRCWTVWQKYCKYFNIVKIYCENSKYIANIVKILFVTTITVCSALLLLSLLMLFRYWRPCRREDFESCLHLLGLLAALYNPSTPTRLCHKRLIFSCLYCYSLKKFILKTRNSVLFSREI